MNTDSKAVKQALEASERRYRTLFDSIDEGFCIIEVIFDAAGKPIDYRFLETNPSFEKQTGLADAKGKRVREFAPKHEEHWFQIYGHVATTGEPIRFRNQAAQLHRWYDVYAFRYGDPEDHQVGVLFNDITENKRKEEALIRSEKLAATGRLAATIAHEVNNPLASAVNAVYLAMTDATASPSVRETLALADQELRRAAHITQQTLGFYRQRANETPVSLRDIVDEVVRIYQRRLKERAIAVDCRYQRGPCADGDDCFLVPGAEMRQVISNLVNNAMDVLPHAGRLYIRGSRTTNRDGNGEDLHLTVADDGGGIAPEHRKRLFEPFFTTKLSVGTGLGLWIAQEIVHRQNGRIRVRSREGQGTVFRVTLPALPASVEGTTASAAD